MKNEEFAAALTSPIVERGCKFFILHSSFFILNYFAFSSM